MFWITIIAVVGFVAYRIDVLNTRAIEKGLQPMSYTNPVTWVKVLVGGLGYMVGYAPKAIDRSRSEIQLKVAESKREVAMAGVATELAFKSNKTAAKVTSTRHHARPTKANDLRTARINRDIEKLKSL